MNNLRDILHDWRRGFTDADIASVKRKLAGPHKPGTVIPVTKKELKAIRATIPLNVPR